MRLPDPSVQCVSRCPYQGVFGPMMRTQGVLGLSEFGASVLYGPRAENEKQVDGCQNVGGAPAHNYHSGASRNVLR
jgi:hypothetical protein